MSYMLESRKYVGIRSRIGCIIIIVIIEAMIKTF